MCSKADTADILKEEFWKKDGIKDQLLAEVDIFLSAKLSRWLLSGGAIIVFGIAAAWFTLRGDVSNNSEKIGNALTRDQAALIIQSTNDLREDVNEIRDTLKGLDARLRTNGI